MNLHVKARYKKKEIKLWLKEQIRLDEQLENTHKDNHDVARTAKVSIQEELEMIKKENKAKDTHPWNDPQ